jgi:hypothetical protein
MTRLFDSEKERKEREEVIRGRQDVRARAEAAEAAINEQLQLDANSDHIDGVKMGQAHGIAPIVYQNFRKPGSKWKIEHTPDGKDYIYQLFPLRKTTLTWQSVMPLLIYAMDVIFPRSVHIRYVPPREDYEVKFYTIKVENVVGKPGWEKACLERALDSLASVDAWQPPPT